MRVLLPSPLSGNSVGISPAGLACRPVSEIKSRWRKATIKTICQSAEAKGTDALAAIDPPKGFSLFPWRFLSLQVRDSAAAAA